MTINRIAGSILAAFVFATFAMAQGGQPNQPPRQRGGDSASGRGDGPFGNRGMRMMRHRMMDFNRLNLTDAQKQRIQALHENQRRTWESNQSQFEEMGRLMQLKRSGLLTTEQGTRLTALEAQMKTNADRMQADLMAILTPEQRTLADQMRNERGSGMKGMRDGRRRGRGQGTRPAGPNRGRMTMTSPTPPLPPPPAPNN